MIELKEKCNIFDKVDEGFVGILTNGVVKPNGCLVMGAGQAKEALDLFPFIDAVLGDHVKEHGNIPKLFEMLDKFEVPADLFSFPTKVHFREPSSFELIKNSAKWLDDTARENASELFFLPRPGCGLGGLRWDDVRYNISFLPDNVIIVTNT